MAAAEEELIRSAALSWVQERTLDGELALTREELANDFHWNGRRFPLIDRGRGIRKPAGWSAALSILTAAPKTRMPRPYDDHEGADGLHRYKLRDGQRGAAENQGLRSAMLNNLPLIWFYGVKSGVFNAISPVYLLLEEPAQRQFALALTADQRQVTPGSAVEAIMKRYLIAQTKQRLHQPVFASQIMLAYETRCAVCALGHRELLDAAHIVADSDEFGLPEVTNGLALCKIHHAAYDRNILGIRPDYVVQIHRRLLDELDGPMLRYGLQGHHGARLRQLPRSRAEQPDLTKLEQRYQEFRVA